jgi:hypothetical protein
MAAVQKSDWERTACPNCRAPTTRHKSWGESKILCNRCRIEKVDVEDVIDEITSLRPFFHRSVTPELIDRLKSTILIADNLLIANEDITTEEYWGEVRRLISQDKDLSRLILKVSKELNREQRRADDRNTAVHVAISTRTRRLS